VPEPPIATEPIVSFESRVTSGISIEVLNAFHAEPPRGKEAGGILLGRPASEPILVEDFEPVLCEHRFGPSYFLSAEDLRGLEESVQWFRTSQAGDLQVLGFYRSQARPESSIDDRDHELMRRFFADPGSLFLLLKPGRGETITAELFVLAEGSLRPAGHPMLFPSDGGSGRHPARRLSIKGLSAGLLRQCDPSGPEPAANGGPGPEKVVDDGIRRTSLPPSRRRHLDTQELVGRNWTWVAALVALIVAAAVLGYRSVGPKHAGTSSEADAGPSSGLATPTSNPMPAPAPGIRTPMTAPQTTVAPETGQGIREALAQWERAVRSGDPGLIAGCYATQLDRYFQQRNSSSEEVRRAAAQSLARYGKPAILRISDLTVIPVSEDRAVASFRKHWQTSGPRIFAGEEQERLIFVKAEDEWKIASEEETKVYWTQKPRG
jgi:ketosteroid isomerase-like protein